MRDSQRSNALLNNVGVGQTEKSDIQRVSV